VQRQSLAAPTVRAAAFLQQRQCRHAQICAISEEREMGRLWIAVLAMAALLAGCAQPVGHEAEPWNGGTWNSVLGYVGPYNVIDDGQSR
jgi:hypothetical protein